MSRAALNRVRNFSKRHDDFAREVYFGCKNDVDVIWHDERHVQSIASAVVMSTAIQHNLLRAQSGRIHRCLLTKVMKCGLASRCR